MTNREADALVIFGITGDLARKQTFRSLYRLERRGLRLVPQPVADAGFGTAGAAAALIDRGARGAHGLQPRQPNIGFVARHPRQA